MQVKQAIVIGASSGIGEALARILSEEGYEVGLVARREDLLLRLQGELPARSFIKLIDIADPQKAMPLLEELVQEMGNVELFVLNAGYGLLNPNLEWPVEDQTVRVNVLGFAATLNVALSALKRRGSGQIVGLSSIAALRGGRHAPAYNASKAFVSSYLDGVRHYCRKNGLAIDVLDVQPGFVRTPMAQGEGLFWVATV